MKNKQRIRRFLPPLILLMALLAFLLPSATNVFAAAPAQDRWAGAVSDVNGEPLMATVTINGTPVEGKEDGSFELYVPRADDNRYVINAEKFGYVPISLVHVGSAIEKLNLTLQEPERFEIDPEQAIEVEDRRGTSISIPAGSLVDADGNPAQGPLQLFVYTYDLTQEEMVGDMSGINGEGDLVSMESAGAFFAQFSDDEGNKYNLAPDAQAKISIPVDQSAEFPQAIPLWSYDQEKGLWIQEGEATQEGERYVGSVSHFSFWNFDVEKREPACIQLTVDPVYLALNSPIQVKAVLNSPTRVRYLSITQTENVLINLPANTNVDFYMPPTAPTPFTSVNTGAPWGGTGVPAHPYDRCNGTLHLDGSQEKGAVSGMKFHDLNGNGVKDDGEPGLEGWVISLTDADNNIITTTTDVDGNYQFTDLLPGSAALSEGWQDGWVQTFPPTVRHTVVLSAGQEIPNIDFGNIQPCENPTSDSCLAGRKDNFDRNDGSEPSSPSQELLNWANGRGANVLSEFDVLPTDRYFLHTFGESDTDTCLSGDCLIVGAKLTLSLKGGRSGLAWNDTIGFQENGVTVWSQRIHNLVPSGTWGPGQVATITLDLANLPANGAGVTNVLAALQDGDFDFYIEDDTGVDFAELEVEKCCDCTPPPPDMVAWWPLDEPSGPTAAEIVNGNDGRHMNGPTPLLGEFVDNSLNFDGSDDYVEVPDAPELNFGEGDFSIDAWIKTTDQSGVKVIVDKRYENYSGNVQGYSVYLKNGKLGFQLADGNGSWTCSTASSSSCTNYDSGFFVADGEWHLVAVTVERDDIGGGTFYVNGNPVATFSPTIRPGSLDNTKPLRIGSRSSFETGLFKGAIDEVELFNRALKEEEIKAIYEAGSAGKCKCEEKDVTFEAGVEDQFSTANGTESPSPSVGLQQLYGTSRNFDDLGSNRRFMHTFSDLLPLLTTEICSATLEIRVKPGREIMHNDTISLRFVDDNGQLLAAPWGRYFGTPPNPKDGLFNYQWGSNGKPAETIVLDLAALPLAPQDGGGTVSVLGLMNTLGFLDVYIQDDTAVDYIKLNVHYCCDKKEGPDLEITKSHSGNFTYGQNNDYQLVVSNIGNTDAAGPITVVDTLPAGMTFVASSGSPWSCSAVGQTVTCTHPGPLPAMTSAPLITLEVAVAPVHQFPGGSDAVSNCAKVEIRGDINQANNADCDRTIIVTPPVGGIRGTVTRASDGAPLAGILAQAYQFDGSLWQPIDSATTSATGEYTINNLLVGDYRVRFTAPSAFYASEYYDDVANIADGSDISVTDGTTTANINAVLERRRPSIAQVEVKGGGVSTNPNSGQSWIELPQSPDESSEIRIESEVKCANGATPTNVQLLVNGSSGSWTYPMNETPPGSGQYTVTLTAADMAAWPRREALQLTIQWDCDGETQSEPIGWSILIDPSGQITDANTGDPIPGATVTLYNVPGWLPKANADDTAFNTCESHNSKDPEEAWSQLAPTDLGVMVNPDISASPTISPTINPLVTGSNGRYAWDVVEGCWYVTVEAEGYESLVSPVVGVPPEVTDLDLQLTPLEGEGISLVPGWNLISVPVQPTDTDINQVLASIAGNFDLVYAYDGCDATDQWKNFNVNAPPFANDLTNVDQTRGLWIHMTAAATLSVSGTTPSTTDIPLCEGWNLVGNPSTQQLPVADALTSISGAYHLVYAYDAADTADPWASHNPSSPPFANDLTEMGPGWGYWIDANQAATWSINN